MEAGSIIRVQRSGMESYYFVFPRNSRRQHMASGYRCVSHSNEIVMLRTLQSSRWKNGLKCRQPLGGHGRIKLRIRMSLDSIWEALAALSTWDSCPRFPELLSSAGLESRQAKLQSDCHEDSVVDEEDRQESEQNCDIHLHTVFDLSLIHI